MSRTCAKRDHQHAQQHVEWIARLLEWQSSAFTDRERHLSRRRAKQKVSFPNHCPWLLFKNSTRTRSKNSLARTRRQTIFAGGTSDTFVAASFHGLQIQNVNIKKKNNNNTVRVGDRTIYYKWQEGFSTKKKKSVRASYQLPLASKIRYIERPSQAPSHVCWPFVPFWLTVK